MTKTRKEYEEELQHVVLKLRFGGAVQAIDKINRIFDDGIRDKAFTVDEVNRWRGAMGAVFSLPLIEKMRYIRAHAKDLFNFKKGFKNEKRD